MTPKFPYSLVVLTFALMSYTLPAWSDQLVNANEAVVLSDDIYKRTTEVIHAGGGKPVPEEGGTLVPAEGGTPDPTGGGTPKAGNDKNRSGLGDGTNPGLGSGRDNSPNEGTKNPNRAGR
jgi:hypothetical protein